MKTYIAIALAVVGSIGSFGCASESAQDPSSESDDSTATQYVGIRDFNNSQFDSTWIDVQNQLNGEFANVCGDSFCEGDFSNLTPLSMNCAVTSIRGDVHDCAWAFAGSLDAVDEDTSVIHVDAPTFQCHFAAKTTASRFIAGVQATDNALQTTLPGMTDTIYDTLVDCFQHPIGASPITFGDDPHPKYVDPLDYYTSAANQTKWQNGQAALKLGFDNICGDTYCDGDFGDIQSMDFNCSVTKSTGKVKSCDWLFAGSYSTVGSKGSVDDVTKEWTCPVTMNGTISQLITTMTTGSDPIQSPLPGVTTSAYDQIGGCVGR
ncbi:MAG TPA: hypothetical protein VGM56_29355 [Byssovorax sp.]|jgi:hypothetical protein